MDAGHPSPLRSASLSAAPVLVGREDALSADALRVDGASESAEEEIPRAVDPALSDSSSECSVAASVLDGADAFSVCAASSAAVPDAALRSAPGGLPPRLRLGSGLDDSLFGAPPSRSPRAKRARGPASPASPAATSVASASPGQVRLPDGSFEHVNPVTGRVLRMS